MKSRRGRSGTIQAIGTLAFIHGSTTKSVWKRMHEPQFWRTWRTQPGELNGGELKTEI